MRENYFTFLFITLAFLLTGNLSAQQETWDILDKSMAAWNVDGSSTVNKAWLFTKGSRTSAASVCVTQEAGYVNVFKTQTYDNNNYGFLTPQPLTLQANTAYTFEVKARMKPMGAK